MGVAWNRIGVFENIICLVKGLVHIALASFTPVSNVGARAREKPWHALVIAQIRMDHHGIFLKGIIQAQHRRKQRILHCNAFGRAQGGFG